MRIGRSRMRRPALVAVAQHHIDAPGAHQDVVAGNLVEAHLIIDAAFGIARSRNS